MNTDHTAAHDAPTHVAGLLALELAPGTGTARDALPQSEAAELAALLGRDLAAVAPEASRLELVLAAAHFDPAEALRPGWPLHRRLAELHERAPGRGSGPRLIAFGAAADGSVPQPLVAEQALRGGSLRVLPFLLHGDPAVVAGVGATFEARLLDTGMVEADTALLAQQAFGARIEHARCLTLHDLVAMVALQYEHLGLAPLWPLIETALLSPDGEAMLDEPPEPLLRYVDGGVRMALFQPKAWRARYRPATDDPERLQRMFGHFETRQRQFTAVLEVHGLDVDYVEAVADVDAHAL